MGGVDLNNMLAGLYRIDHRSRKWTRRIYFWVIGTVTTNAWQLYRREYEQVNGQSTGTMDLLQFTNMVSESLCLEGKEVPLFKGRRPRKPAAVMEPGPLRSARAMPSVVQDAQEDQYAHWPANHSSRKQCRLCSQLSFTYCTKCNAFLCLNKARNCFTAFHT